MINLKDKKILVLGFARSGYSTAKILNKLGYDVTLNAYDDLSTDEKAAELRELGVKVIDGGHPLELLENIDLIVKNPGIKYQIEFLQKAIDKKIDIITEIELANTLFNIDMVAITGTNGKTTTTQMTFDILKAANKDVFLAGNIGYPSIEIAYNHPNSLLVTEVSSFQLQGTKYFKPSIAVITNLGVGHLDYHGSVENYRDAKRNIYKNQDSNDILILNINEKDKFGGTALDWLIERYFITVVTPKAEISEDKKKEIAFLTSQNARILLDHGISTKFDIVDILTKTGAMDFIQKTPLEQLNHISELDKSVIHNWILWSGNEYEKSLNLKKLLELCDINKGDINGDTPLYYAVDGWLFKPELEDVFKTAIICLLRHHADDQIKNKDGITIYDLMDEHQQLKFKQWKILSQSEAKSDPVIMNGKSYSTASQ